MLNDLCYTSNESLFYTYLLNENGFNSINDSIGGNNVVNLFLKSKLDKGILKKIWDLSSVRKEPDLNKLEFFCACRYVALAQRGEELTHKNAVSLNYKDVMPKFEGIIYDQNKKQKNSNINSNNYNNMFSYNNTSNFSNMKLNTQNNQSGYGYNNINFNNNKTLNNNMFNNYGANNITNNYNYQTNNITKTQQTNNTNNFNFDIFKTNNMNNLTNNIKNNKLLKYNKNNITNNSINYNNTYV